MLLGIVPLGMPQQRRSHYRWWMYETYQREIEAMAVWSTLRGNLWHATSVVKAAPIIADGAIRIGEFSAYKRSHCHKLDCVSLFDFSASLERIAGQFSNWQGWFGYQSHIKGKATVWFKISRDAVRNAVKSIDETVAEWALHHYAQHMPGVEVCHRGPVPLSAVSGALVISRQDRSQFRMIEPGGAWAARIEAYAAELPELPPPSPLELAITKASGHLGESN